MFVYSKHIMKDQKKSLLLLPAEQLERVRHSLAHLMAAAVLKQFPDAKLGIGPVIDDGFYYDFKLPRTLTPEDLVTLAATMRELAAQKLPFTKKIVTPAIAKRLLNNQPFKLELAAELQAAKKSLSFYETGKDVFKDLCAGPHVKNTFEIDLEAFKLTKIAGAYWRGDAKRDQLQRIYGVAFSSKQELDDYLRLMEEAQKRDHRKLGKDLQLFMISDEVGPGLPLFYPHGAILRRTVENFMIELQERRGYEPIWIPHITRGELYKISGHLEKYDALYPPMQLKDEDAYYIKPMNCPHFMMLYKSTPHSYRELPVRWTCTTTNYRYEKSGELSGLTRVRALTQDDCHVFATPSQIEGEINLMLDMISEVYATFGFNDFWVCISTHDPKNKTKYIGDPKTWKASEEILMKLIKNRGWKYEIGIGEAAFYGPKLDFIFNDVLRREWQLSTIQLDMNLPKRFALTYIDETGAEAQPVVIHRAILGSTERFLGILIEHFAGKFPLWLAPLQVQILPVSEKFIDYGKTVLGALRATNLRASLDPANETLGKRIRAAQLAQIPYILIVGDKEVQAQTVSVRHSAKGDLGVMGVEVLIQKLETENKTRSLN